jgi:hypothetical protein
MDVVINKVDILSASATAITHDSSDYQKALLSAVDFVNNIQNDEYCAKRKMPAKLATIHHLASDTGLDLIQWYVGKDIPEKNQILVVRDVGKLVMVLAEVFYRDESETLEKRSDRAYDWWRIYFQSYRLKEGNSCQPTVGRLYIPKRYVKFDKTMSSSIIGSFGRLKDKLPPRKKKQRIE